MKIREYYNTISDFYLKVCGNKVVSREDFLKILKNLNLNFTSNDKDEIWMQLDKINNGKIYALNFKTLFWSHIEADLKFIITRIYQALNNYDITFLKLMRTITGPIGFQSMIWRSPFDNISYSPGGPAGGGERNEG